MVRRSLAADAEAEVERLDIPELQPIEDALIAQQWNDRNIGTRRGTFVWEPRG
jgi:hypothetical protein